MTNRAPTGLAHRPTITGIMEPLRDHWAALGIAFPARGDEPLPLEPIDALLLHLLAATLPDITHIVDGLADATLGGTTALWRAHPRGLVLASLTENSPGRKPALVALPAAAARRKEDWADWLSESNGAGAVLAFYPLGAAGDSRELAALVAAASPDGPWRLWLPRERTGFFTASRLGIVARHDDTRVDQALTRIVRLYDGNFQFLELIADTVDQASLAAQVQRQRATIERIEAELAETRATLAEITDSLAWSMARRLSDVRGWLAPKGSRRYSLFRRVSRNREDEAT